MKLQARERCVADRARQVRLTFLDRRRIFGRGHRVLAEASIIQLFDVHAGDVVETRRAGKTAVGHRLIVRQNATLPQMLRKPVGNVVIVALLGHEDVHVQMCPGRVVERAHGDRDLIAPHRIPEKG